MKEYFKLQFRMLNRQLVELGIEPFLAYIISPILFYFGTISLFKEVDFAEYIYFFTAVFLILKLSETNRNSFLKQCFSKLEYFQLRIVENSIISLPFLGFLLFYDQFSIALLLLLLTILVPILHFEIKSNFTIKTPFYKFPFEFTVGFRNTFYVFLGAYFLTYKAISSGNLNLGIFALLLSLVVCLSFYLKPENKFFVWIFALTPKEFIAYKLRIILIYTTLICLPITISLSVFFHDKALIIIGIQFLGCFYLYTGMLAKYFSFPDEISIKQGIVFCFLIWLPPLLIIILPYLYFQSIKKLNKIL
jgi:hypothetical protein